VVVSNEELSKPTLHLMIGACSTCNWHLRYLIYLTCAMV